MRPVLLFFILTVFGNCGAGIRERSKGNTDDFETEIGHTAFYEKNRKSNNRSWSEVYDVSDVKIRFEAKGDSGRPVIIIFRKPHPDTFYVIDLPVNLKPEPVKHYPNFKFLGTFDTRGSAFDYYFDFYVNDEKKDFFEVLKRYDSHNSLMKEDMGILYLHDSTNYLKGDESISKWK
ncbi:hypothetical protein [Filimonas effusa]|uniref:Uncharacterized protein n=1 Tax=Filimonas effusa TaxID=2508721 RepID=A0A4Q1DCP7_9BACT|nr:hypothetical protein [Filimonas effusa]RXK87140.1 hypothetical protein ESB13_10280 [Filimonas effusa]